MMTNTSLDNVSLGSGTRTTGGGYKQINFNSQSGKKSMMSGAGGVLNNTGSQTRINIMQSPRSPAMLKCITKNGRQDDTSVQLGVAESSAEEQYMLMEGENTSSMQVSHMSQYPKDEKISV